MAVYEKPDDDLRIDAAFLAVSDLAELVFVLDLEMQGRHVIHHQCHVSVSGGVAVTSRSQLVSVTPPCDPGQTAVHPRPVHRNNPELGQDPGAVQHRCRLDQAGQHELEERLITDHVETQRLPSSPDHLNQQSGTAPSDHRRLRGCRCAEVQHLLIWWDQLGPASGHQHSQPGLVMGRPEMLDDPVFAAFLDHDLHSCRPGSGLHLPQERAHLPDPTPRLVTHTTHPKRPDKHQHNPQTRTQPQLRQVRFGVRTAHRSDSRRAREGRSLP